MADVSLDVAPAQSQPSMMMKGNHQNQRRQYGNGGGNNNGRCCTCRGRRGVCSLILMTIMQVIVLLVALFGTMTSFWIDPPTVSLGAPGQSVGVVHAGLYRVCYPKTLADQNDVTTNVTIAGPLDAAWRDFREGFLALTPGRSGEFGDVPGAYERCTVAVKTHFYSNVYGENYWPRVQAVQVLAPAFVLLGLLKLVLMYVVNRPGMNDWPPFGVALVQVACGIAVVSVFATIYSDVAASAPQGPVVVFTGEQGNDVVVTSAPDQSVTQLWGWSFWTFASAVLSELLGALMMMC